MATIVLKNVPAELRRRLEERARASGRTVNDEIVAALEGVVGPTPRSVRDVEREIAEIRTFRAKLAAKGFAITDEEITAWKRKGRP